GYHKVIFRELEAGEEIHATGNDFSDAPRRESMSRVRILRKWWGECDGTFKVGIATLLEIVLRLGLVTLVPCEFGEMVVHLTQPSSMGRLINVFDTPCQLLMRGFSLSKEARKLRVNYTSDPVHDEHLAARQLLCLIQNRHRFLDIAIAAHQRQRRRML